MTKVYILGAGPAGCATAYFLKAKGLDDITVVERRAIGGCSRTRTYHDIPYEFGPQVMYTDEARLRAVFETFLRLTPPPTADGRYRPALSIDGNLDEASIHSFPVTFANILRLPNAAEVIEELYNVNLEKPDYSSFEAYVISRIGPTLYRLYVEGYNTKQWRIHPRDMDAEWARFRPFTLRGDDAGMFKHDWQGHPGNYNPIWEGMLKGVKVVKGEARLSDDYETVTVDGSIVTADLIVSTLPLADALDFVSACLVYVGIRSASTLMPSYATSFPNNYEFVRVMEYRQQYAVDSDYTLLDFQFPWIGTCPTDEFIAQAKWFVREKLGREVAELWVDNRERIYPVSTKANLDLVERQLQRASRSAVVPLGRCGVHAYVSKDTCIRMAIILAERLDDVLSGDPDRKLHVLRLFREKLT